MRITRWLRSSALMLVIVAAAWGPAAAAPAAPNRAPAATTFRADGGRPAGGDFPGLLWDLCNADTVWVRRLSFTSRILKDNPRAKEFIPHTLTQARPGRDWAIRFARALAAGHYVPNLECGGPPPVGGSPRIPYVSVFAQRGREVLVVELAFREPCADLVGSLPPGRVDLTPCWPELLDLVREALPRDTVLARFTLPRVRR